MKFLRKTVIGISTIAFTALTLGTATYAWFPINSQAKIDTTELSVTGGLGFMVSVDGVNYKNDLSKDDIYNALLVSYRPDLYKIGYNSETGLSVLCQTKAVEVMDENGEPVTQLVNGVETPVMEYVPDLDNPITATEKANALKGIELMPLTSSDGVNFTDLYNSSASATSGRFMEFSVYFKTTSSTGSYIKASSYQSNVTYYEMVITDDVVSYQKVDQVTEENYKNYYVFSGTKYDIYLNGETQYSDARIGQESIEISPTKFRSVATRVDLSADMTAVVNGEVKALAKGGNVTVYSSNAIRLSITDNEAFTSTAGASGTNIYELNDDKYGSLNLGSYATTYSAAAVMAHRTAFTDSQKNLDPSFDLDAYIASLDALYGEEYAKQLGLVYSVDLDYKYNHDYNAMFTYYNNLKQTTTLQSKLLSYYNIPTTIKDLTSMDDNRDYIYNKKITTLSSDEDGKLITFRIWLEGWDADCFDGLKDSITASLSFSSRRIY